MAEPLVVADRPRLYGLLAEFGSSEELLQAAHAVRDAGYVQTDAFSPLPVEGLSEALGVRTTRLPLVVLLGGILGGLLGYGLQYYVAVELYPINIGGRPLNSWQSFVPVTFELTILGAALAAVLGMLGSNRLPQPHHPLFNDPEFTLASGDRFYLCIEVTDPHFELAKTTNFLQGLGPSRVTPVET